MFFSQVLWSLPRPKNISVIIVVLADQLNAVKMAAGYSLSWSCGLSLTIFFQTMRIVCA